MLYKEIARKEILQKNRNKSYVACVEINPMRYEIFCRNLNTEKHVSAATAESLQEAMEIYKAMIYKYNALPREAYLGLCEAFNDANVYAYEVVEQASVQPNEEMVLPTVEMLSPPMMASVNQVRHAADWSEVDAVWQGKSDRTLSNKEKNCRNYNLTGRKEIPASCLTKWREAFAQVFNEKYPDSIKKKEDE